MPAELDNNANRSATMLLMIFNAQPRTREGSVQELRQVCDRDDEPLVRRDDVATKSDTESEFTILFVD